MNEPTNKTLFVTMLVLGGIIILILLVPRSLGGNYVYNSRTGLSASATPFYDDNYNYYQQANLDFGGYGAYQPVVYTNTTPKTTTTTTYTYSYPSETSTQYPTSYDYNNYYGNDYSYPYNYYNQYQSPTNNPNYNPSYPGGCNPGYTYSITTGQLCRGVY